MVNSVARLGGAAGLLSPGDRSSCIAVESSHRAGRCHSFDPPPYSQHRVDMRLSLLLSACWRPASKRRSRQSAVAARLQRSRLIRGRSARASRTRGPCAVALPVPLPPPELASPDRRCSPCQDNDSGSQSPSVGRRTTRPAQSCWENISRRSLPEPLLVFHPPPPLHSCVQQVVGFTCSGGIAFAGVPVRDELCIAHCASATIRAAKWWPSWWGTRACD